MDIKKEWYWYALALVVVLVVAYFLFQGKQGAGFLNSSGTTVASSTVLASTTTGPNGAKIEVTTPSGGGGQFGIVFDTTNLHLKIGDQLPTIGVNLPANSANKVIVLALKPTTSTSTFATEIIFGYILNTNATTTQIQGVSLTQYIDGKTGTQHLPIQPGTYEIEAVLWDRNPFYTNGVYGDFTNNNNATAVLSGSFTISS